MKLLIFCRYLLNFHGTSSSHLAGAADDRVSEEVTQPLHGEGAAAADAAVSHVADAAHD